MIPDVLHMRRVPDVLHRRCVPDVLHMRCVPDVLARWLLLIKNVMKKL